MIRRFRDAEISSNCVRLRRSSRTEEPPLKFLRPRSIALIGIALLIASCSGSPPAPVVAEDSNRSVEQGEIVGTLGAYGSHVWRGIPYARPPVGNLRWRAPQHAESWSGTRQALAQGDFCPQFASPFGGVAGETGEVLGSEDCLFLDVYAPRLAADAVPTGKDRLPVMFWIHGGGNVIGHAGFYDGGKLAESQNVVVVAINYRLGPLGWFRHASLREGDSSPVDRSGNYGTLDMIRALEWVRGNISAFGGDPGNVTIFGESAGGTDVYTMLLSPRAGGLFHRAISQSGGTYLVDPALGENFTDDANPGHAGSSNEVLLSLLRADGIAADREDAKAQLAKMTPNQIASFLRSKPAADFFGGYVTDAAEGLIDVPKLFKDGVVLPEGDPLELLADADSWNRVPVITGTNRDENKLFMFANPRWVKRWFGIIPRLVDEEGFNLQAKYQTLMWRASGSDEPATAMRRSSDAVWSYRFDWDEEPSLLGADLSVMLGASHGFEIPFVFGHYDLGEQGNVIFDEENLPGRDELSAGMMSYWVHFAQTGEPDRGRDGVLPEWTAWSQQPDGDKFIVLDTAQGGGIRMAKGSVTQNRVGQLAANDADLLLREDRCAILSEVKQWSGWEGPDDCNATPSVAATE
jgi:para-nitrobenzyl esterase